MSKSLNEFKLIGNLGQNPEVAFLPNGNAVATISVATSESWKDKQTGQPKEKTQWHRCKAFGKLADIMGQYLKKGSKAYFCGKIEYSEFTDKDGIKRYSTDLIIDDMLMLDGNPNAGQQQGGFQAPQQQAPQQQGGFQQQAPQQQGGFQQQAPQQQGGFQQQAPQQQGGFQQQAPQQQGGFQQQAPAQQSEVAQNRPK